MSSGAGIVEPIVLDTRKVFNRKRYDELMKDPPNKLYYNGHPFRVDIDFFRKQLLYCYNLLFKTLDINILNGGEEGTAKTTDSSQIGFIFHFILVECNIINKELGTYYEYTSENCLSHNLVSFLKKCDKFNDHVFRIIICDEAGDLKSEKRWDDWNMKFRDEMRKDRKKLKIRIVNYPQPFELVKDFTLARVNCIRIHEFREDPIKGLVPDIVHTIIIPRGKHTFSWYTHETITKLEMKNALGELTKERYTKELSKKFIYKTSKKDDVFCFDVAKYVKQAKEENRLFLKEEKIFISHALIKIFANNLTSGRIGLSTTKWKNLSGVELEEAEKEKREALLVSKLVDKCRKVIAKSKKVYNDETE